MRFGKSIYFALATLLAASACTHLPRAMRPVSATAARTHEAITRGEVLKIARSYASATWQCTGKNADDHYNRVRPGMIYQGVAYNWGGWDTVEAYQKKIKDGAIAGTTRKEEHKDFAGVDCSGFVSRCWGLTRRRYSTYTIHKVSRQIAWADLRPGDIMNLPHSHVRLFEKYDPADPDLVWVYESTGDSQGKYGVKVDPPRVIHRAVHKSTMVAQGYLPRRYVNIVD